MNDKVGRRKPGDDEELLSFLRSCPKFSQVSNFTKTLLAGDGSGRSFHRLAFEKISPSSAVLLNTPEGIGPKLSGDTSLTQENAFVELCKYFPDEGIPVPRFYGYDEDNHWVLMEDVGNLPLYKFLTGDLSANEEPIADGLGGDPVIALFKKAIDITARLQKIPHNPQKICFRRFLGFENYRNEIKEFTEFYGAQQGIKQSAAQALEPVYDAICETLMSFPKTLSLFDYNAHNLFVSPEGELRVLDFQDSCLVTAARDIVSLINDRSLDELLGQKRHSELLKYFITSAKLGERFEFTYNMTLLHWDLRVSGRFIKLNQKFRTDKYQQWVPSTLRRLGRTLQRVEKSLHGLSTLLEIAHELSPETREGFLDPWDFPAPSMSLLR